MHCNISEAAGFFRFAVKGAVLAGTFFLSGCLGGQAQKTAGKQPQPVPPAANTERKSPEWQADRYSDPTAAQNKEAPKGCPTQDTAIRMAMGQILQKYGRESLNRQLPLVAAVDDKGVWTVSGTLPPLTEGRVSKVRIDSRTGKVLSVK